MAREAGAPKPTQLSLPVSVATVADVTRLANELERVNETLLQLELRSGGQQAKMPKTSRLLDQAVETNKLNLLLAADRKTLSGYLAALRDKAPVLHISFSADPTPAFIENLMVWIRREIHPQALLTIGLQPNLGAGCMLRVGSKYYDFSLRQDFLDKRGLLLQKMAETSPEAQP